MNAVPKTPPAISDADLALDVTRAAGVIVALGKAAWSQLEAEERDAAIRILIDPLYEAARRLQRGKEAQP